MRFIGNKYIDTYVHSYVIPFHNFSHREYQVNISGLTDFMTTDNGNVAVLINELKQHGFAIELSQDHTSIQGTLDEIQVEFTCNESGEHGLFNYKVEGIISTIELSAKTDISVVGLLLMQVISQIICRARIMYKAIILDLDDTLWKGTLAEDGFMAIKRGLNTDSAAPFVMFMRFIKVLAQELGLFTAICSRNDINAVKSAIAQFDTEEFPIKDQIDIIVANDNDKSKNIQAIAQHFSILTSACVFIDDNALIRDEVRKSLPEVFVPEWQSHEELLNLLVSCCIFDRIELSLSSRARKHQYAILQQAREQNALASLLIKTSNDPAHTEANRLYIKSNQFKFSQNKPSKDSDDGCRSLAFTLYRTNGEQLGICSALTYKENDQKFHVLNWAISCRYFGIGLEEYILLHLASMAGTRPITFAFEDSKLNGKAAALLEKYSNIFVQDNEHQNVLFAPDAQAINEIKLNTLLKDYDRA